MHAQTGVPGAWESLGHATLRTEMDREGKRMSVVAVTAAEDTLRFRWLTCPGALLRVRMLNAPYTIGFMQELVQANRNRPLWTRGSTAFADTGNSQYLQQLAVKSSAGNKSELKNIYRSVK